MESKIRWGVVGPGKIARKFMSDLKLVHDAELTGVGSRNLVRAQEFAKEFNVPHIFGSYEELFQSPEVDVLYIATPHNFHKDLAIMAMEHGKHILCEKPLGISREEVEKMVAASKKNNVFLMEAMWSRFNPTIQKVKQMIDDEELGKLCYLHADFAFYALDRDESSRIWNLDLASSSLLDIGIYPVFLAYLLLGMPDKILATSNFHSNGTELQTSMIFDYGQAQAVLYSGLTSRSSMIAEVSCEKGELLLNSRWHEADGYRLIKDGKEQEFRMPPTGIGYYHEIMEVHECMRAKKVQSDLWSHQNSLDLSELLDTIREKCGITFPFET